MRDSLTRRLVATVCLALASVTLPSLAQPRDPAARPPILGDFAAEIRRPDGHMDVRANIQALKEMRANTYFYLIWHKETDWDDLPAFAEAAEREGINVWVYLIP